jgi:hypothetical protein
MADIAALNLQVNSSSVEQANVALREMPKAASAAERAAAKFSATTREAANSNEQFSKRTQKITKDLEFERQQLLRSSAEREKYIALRRAGVVAASAEGRAIAGSVAALQAQRAAIQSTAASQARMAAVTTSIIGGFKGLAAAYIGVQAAQKIWTDAMSAGDLGEQAEQVGVTTDQLQAYRLVAAQAGVEAEQFDVALTKLARTMGSANDGNKESIELFNSLGVKILDAAGKMRPVADVLPEVATGLVKIGTGSEQTAKEMEIFGKSGAKLTTMLGDLTQGNDALIASARKENALISPDTIKAWDTVGDSMKVVEQQWKTLIAEFGAPIVMDGFNSLIEGLRTTKEEIQAIGRAWQWVKGLVGNATGTSLSGMQEEAGKVTARIERLQSQPPTTMNQAELQRELARLSVLQRNITDSTPAVTMPPVTVTASATTGASSPRAKSGGGAASPKVIDEAAAAAKKLADFMADANANTANFIAMQEVDRKALFLSAEGAEKLKLETEMLNKARGDGITLSVEDTQVLSEHAQQMAASSEQTRRLVEQQSRLAEAFDFAKEVASGFMADLRSGLTEGKSLWESFGAAASNVLDRIATKLLDMAATKVFEAALGPVFSILGSAIGGAFGGGLGGGLGGGSGMTFANGGVFNQGNVIPFATGGIVNRPTVFPFARGVGLMGEAGPEAIMPLRRGRGGRLGVEAGAGGGGGQPVVVYVTGDTDLVRVTANQEAVKVVTSAAPQIEGSAVSKSLKAVPSAVAVDHAERGGDYRT